MDNWHHKKDPYGVIPVGFVGPGYLVLGFSSPAGKGLKSLMVIVHYSDYGTTNLNYLTVMRDF